MKKYAVWMLLAISMALAVGFSGCGSDDKSNLTIQGSGSKS